MLSKEDPYYVLMKDLCNGGIKEIYPPKVMDKKESILDFFVKNNIAIRTGGGYACTNIGIECFRKLNKEIDEEKWYSAVENVLLS